MQGIIYGYLSQLNNIIFYEEITIRSQYFFKVKKNTKSFCQIHHLPLAEYISLHLKID